jgi:hypothetical protein
MKDTGSRHDWTNPDTDIQVTTLIFKVMLVHGTLLHILCTVFKNMLRAIKI